jgi:hypothetical protein
MTDPLRVLNSFPTGDSGFDPHLTQEWLVTNGLGRYASGTVLGPITRRYHGLLIAALPNPLGRFMTTRSASGVFAAGAVRCVEGSIGSEGERVAFAASQTGAPRLVSLKTSDSSKASASPSQADEVFKPLMPR